MEFVKVFRVILSRAARYHMIAIVSSSACDHATLSGRTEKDPKCRVISIVDIRAREVELEKWHYIITMVSGSESVTEDGSNDELISEHDEDE